MANLLWKTQQAITRLLDTPFGAEEEFERLIFATPAILEDIFLLKRQIRGGGRKATAFRVPAFRVAGRRARPNKRHSKTSSTPFGSTLKRSH